MLLAKVPSGVNDLDEFTGLSHEVFGLGDDADEAEKVEGPEEEGHALSLLDGAAKLDELAQIPEASIGDERLAGVLVMRKAIRKLGGDL